MSQQTALYLMAAILIGLTLIVPQIIALRIRFLHWLHWHRLADWHQRNIRLLIPAFRVVLVAIAGVLILAGLDAL